MHFPPPSSIIRSEKDVGVTEPVEGSQCERGSLLSHQLDPVFDVRFDLHNPIIDSAGSGKVGKRPGRLLLPVHFTDPVGHIISPRMICRDTLK